MNFLKHKKYAKGLSLMSCMKQEVMFGYAHLYCLGDKLLKYLLIFLIAGCVGFLGISSTDIQFTFL